MDASERRHLHHYLGTWRAFVIAALPFMLGSVLFARISMAPTFDRRVLPVARWLGLHEERI
jgi:hypothetical protein